MINVVFFYLVIRNNDNDNIPTFQEIFETFQKYFFYDRWLTDGRET